MLHLAPFETPLRNLFNVVEMHKTVQEMALIHVGGKVLCVIPLLPAASNAI